MSEFITEEIPDSVLTQASVPAFVELFKIDLSELFPTTPNVFYLTPEPQEVVWGGRTFMPFPVRLTGLEQSSSGAPPRPKIEVANIYQNRLFGTLAFQHNDIIGGKIEYIRTLAIYLGDPTQSICAAPMRFEIFKKEAHNKTFISFLLRTPLDRERAFLPKRQMLRAEFPGLGLYKRV
jgi:lambda family phage minor tail protein L